MLVHTTMIILPALIVYLDRMVSTTIFAKVSKVLQLIVTILLLTTIDICITQKLMNVAIVVVLMMDVVFLSHNGSLILISSELPNTMVNKFLLGWFMKNLTSKILTTTMKPLKRIHFKESLFTLQDKFTSSNTSWNQLEIHLIQFYSLTHAILRIYAQEHVLKLDLNNKAE